MKSIAGATQLALPLAATLRTADDLLARLRVLGLRRVVSCRLTRNRNVMVSVSGHQLRVHEGYLEAPDDVLLAIVRFIESRARADRSEARRRLLAFPLDTGAAPPPRRTTTYPDDELLAGRLTEWHARLNASHFAGGLRPLRVRVSRRMRARLGQYTAATRAEDPAEIAISRRHLRREGWEEALRTLLHEMVHQWQDENGYAIDHGRIFRSKAREVGIPASARRTAAA